MYLFREGDIVTLKKQHPCGSREWEILRIGSDLKLRCLGCGHQIMSERRKIEKNVKSVRINSSEPKKPAADKES